MLPLQVRGGDRERGGVVAGPDADPAGDSGRVAEPTDLGHRATGLRVNMTVSVGNQVTPRRASRLGGNTDELTVSLPMRQAPLYADDVFNCKTLTKEAKMRRLPLHGLGWNAP